MDTAGGKGQAKSSRNHLELFRYSVAGRKDVVGGRRPKEDDDDGLMFTHARSCDSLHELHHVMALHKRLGNKRSGLQDPPKLPKLPDPR